MRLAVIFVAAMTVSSFAHANVCSRQSSVVFALEKIFNKSCRSIGSSDLSKLTSLIIDDAFPEPVYRKSDFAGMTRLRTLRLDHSYMNTIAPDVFQGLSTLEYLSLGWCYFDAPIPDGLFKGLKNLRELHLDNAGFTAVPAGAFDDLDNLRILNLDRNPIQSLPSGLFSKAKRLNGLYVANTLLTTLPNDLFSNMIAKTVLLYGNTKMTVFPEDAFAPYKGTGMVADVTFPFSTAEKARMNAKWNPDIYFH